MAAGATYEPIATTTLGSAGSITFSSIPSTYTDLRLVVSGKSSSSYSGAIRFNGISTTTYSSTNLIGDGTAASSIRVSSDTAIYVGGWGASAGTTYPALITIDIFSYAGATYKTVLGTWSNDMNGTGSTERCIGLWRSTSAITSLSLFETNYAIGTVATLYGIKAA